MGDIYCKIIEADPVKVHLRDEPSPIRADLGKITTLKRSIPTKSGQVTSYSPGDDGDYQMGNQLDPRYIDNADGTILDRQTELMWVKQPELIIPGALGVHPSNQIQSARGDWANDRAYQKADLVKDTEGDTYWVCVVEHTSSGAPVTFLQERTANPSYWRQTVWTQSAVDLLSPSYMTWTQALDGCAALEYAGHNDWRLPNMKELISLWKAEGTAPYIAGEFFPNTNITGRYWSSTTRPNYSYYAIYVNFNIVTMYAITKTYSYYMFARPVRGGILA